jgi:hypothetical protein
MDNWIKIQINIMKSKEAIRLMAQNFQDSIDYILMFICKSKSILENLPLDQRVPAKVLGNLMWLRL